MFPSWNKGKNYKIFLGLQLLRDSQLILEQRKLVLQYRALLRLFPIWNIFPIIDHLMNLLKDCIINGHPGFCLIFILGKYKGFQSESLLKMSPSSPSIKEFGLDGVRKIAPEENCPPVRVRVWFRISVRIRAGG